MDGNVNQIQPYRLIVDSADCYNNQGDLMTYANLTG